MQPTVDICGVGVLVKKGGCIIRRDKGNAMQENGGEHFGRGCSKQQGISLAWKMGSVSTNSKILGAEAMSREPSLFDP